MSQIEVGCKVEIHADESFTRCKWWPVGTVTGNVQKIFKNGKVAVAVHQLRNIQDNGDGLRTLHFPKSSLKAI